MTYKYPEEWNEDNFGNLSGEDDRYEWKLGQTFSQSDENKFRKKIAEELGAFANSFGGTLFVGVSDSKEIVGVRKTWRGRQSIKEWLENVIPTLFELRLQHFRVSDVSLLQGTQEKIGDDKTLIAIDVLDSELAPHQCVHDKKYYYRVSSKSDPAPHHYLAFLWSRANSNMSNVANWWFRNFLDPMIDLLGKVKTDFDQNSFTLHSHQLSPIPSPYIFYKIKFFEDGKWNELMTSGAGEYFLSSFPLIEKELLAYKELVDSFTESFSNLEKSIEVNPQFLSVLVNYYEMLIRNERISKDQYENKNIYEISQLIVGQLRNPLSAYPTESKDSLVRYIAYLLLNIKPILPESPYPEDATLLTAADYLTQKILEDDNSIIELAKINKELFESVKRESVSLWINLKQERIELAKRYTAIFS